MAALLAVPGGVATAGSVLAHCPLPCSWPGTAIRGPNRGGFAAPGFGLGPLARRVFDIRNPDPNLGGLQQGVAFEYIAGSKGTVQRDQVFNYQKNGTAFFDPGTTVNVLDSDFDGGGPTPVIARNGVQYADHAGGLVRNNTIHDHEYTGCSKQDSKATGCTFFQSAGILLFNIDQPNIDTSLNLFRNNDKNLFNVPTAAVK